METNELIDCGDNEIEKVKITTSDKIDLTGWFYDQNLEKFIPFTITNALQGKPILVYGNGRHF